MTNWSVPVLTDLDPGIRPSEFKVLVKMADLPKKTAGGIILTDKAHERDAFGATHARLVALSPLAFTYSKDWPDAPLAKPRVGDVVHVGKFPGDEIIGRDGLTYRLVNDRDIEATIEEPANG